MVYIMKNILPVLSFNRFFGKNLMFADTSDTVPELGDTMTHEGTPLTAEQKAAETYHADKVYFCTNGTTSANSICWKHIMPCKWLEKTIDVPSSFLLFVLLSSHW